MRRDLDRAGRAGRAGHPGEWGFSLVELLAAVLLTSIILGVATTGMMNLTRQSEAAIRTVETPRRALAILDRVARDLEGAVLVAKPDGVDPLYHPWLFFAEDADEDEGAERAKWISSARRPRSEQQHDSNFEQVSWWIARDELGEAELRRGAAPGLPQALDRELPDDGALVARNVASFGLRFQSTDGAWQESWDSSLLAHSSDLPIAAEISLALFPDAETAEVAGPFRRTVLLPMRPVDGSAGAQEDNEAGDGEEDEEDGLDEGMSLSQCLDAHPELTEGLDPGTLDVVSQLQGSAASLQDLLPFDLPGSCL